MYSCDSCKTCYKYIRNLKHVLLKLVLLMVDLFFRLDMIRFPHCLESQLLMLFDGRILPLWSVPESELINLSLFAYDLEHYTFLFQLLKLSFTFCFCFSFSQAYIMIFTFRFSIFTQLLKLLRSRWHLTEISNY